VKNKEDFTGKLQKFNVTIQGFNGSTKIKFKGTWKFRIADQQGTVHNVMIPNTLFASEAPYHLLSPQHWSQQSKDPKGTYCIIKQDKMILFWEGGKLSKQVTLDNDSNCGFIRTIPTYRKYKKFAMAMNSHTVKTKDKWRDIVEPGLDSHNHDDGDIEPITPFNFDNGAQAPKKMNLTHKDDKMQKELWRSHLKLNHLSFAKIRVMALQGELPKRLNTTDVPFCPTCAYSKATRKPW